MTIFLQQIRTIARNRPQVPTQMEQMAARLPRCLQLRRLRPRLGKLEALPTRTPLGRLTLLTQKGTQTAMGMDLSVLSVAA